MNRRTHAALALLAILMYGCQGGDGSRAVDNNSKLAPDDGEALIREYIARDGRGERLRASAWFSDRVQWPVEPGWDESTVVASYSIERVAADSQSVRCRVVQRTLGFVSATDSAFLTFRESPSTDTVIFQATATSLGWRLVGPRYNPHVSLAAAIADSSLENGSRRRQKRQ